MTAARSSRQTGKNAAPAKKASKRAKVLATDMGIETPVAKKRVAKKKPVKKKIVKKTVAKKAASKKTTPKKAAPVVMDDAQPIVSPADSLELKEPRPARRSAVERLNDPPPADGPLLIARVANAIERELTQIEIIVGQNRVAPRERSEAERRARTLASLARTLAVVTQLRAKNLQSVADDADDAAMPRDLDEFRETLARRLEQLLAEQPEPADSEPDPA